MKKFISLFVSIICLFVFATSAFAIPMPEPATSIEASTGYSPEINPIDSGVISTASHKLTGIIKWFGYVLAIILLLITIITTISMIKAKKSVGKIILFDLIMAVIIYLVLYFATIYK